MPCSMLLCVFFFFFSVVFFFCTLHMQAAPTQAYTHTSTQTQEPTGALKRSSQRMMAP
jgi:hypothetical protein